MLPGVVALLAEGGDRNKSIAIPADLPSIVALLAEGGDRNICKLSITPSLKKSPSSRRAWIEIAAATARAYTNCPVALLAEGVDRNKVGANARELLR